MTCHCFHTDTLLEQGKVWAGAFAESSPLLGLSGVSKLPAAEVLPLVQLAEVCLASHGPRLAASDDAGTRLACRSADPAWSLSIHGMLGFCMFLTDFMS